MLSFIMLKYISRSSHKEDFDLVKPASVIDRMVDWVKYDLFWNTCSGLDDLQAPEASTDIPESIPGKLSSEPVIPIVLKSFSWPGKTRSLSSLIGSDFASASGDVVGGKNEMPEYLENIADMSTEFNVPPTTIIRNHSIYSRIYRELKKKF